MHLCVYKIKPETWNNIFKQFIVRLAKRIVVYLHSNSRNKISVLLYFLYPITP
jgi:hypothetical protein